MKLLPLVGLLLLTATFAGCFGSSGSAPPDTDKDGLTDNQETNGWDVTVDLVGHRITRHVVSDPTKQDTDGDGVPDGVEFAYPGGLDPRNKDTDLDGLTDCQETTDTVVAHCEDPAYKGPFDGGTHTSPNNADSDHGPDRYVNRAGFYQDDTGTVVRPVTWGDGIPDGQELRGYDVTLANGTVRHVTTDPLNADTDNDGLGDGEERDLFHTDPTAADTDLDGCKDGFDPIPQRDERYHLGLQKILVSKAGSGDAHLQFTVVAFDVLRVPDTGTLTVSRNSPTDLAAQEPAAFTHGDCLPPNVHYPYDPILPLTILVQDRDQGTLDLSSHSLPAGQGATVYWNVADGTFSSGKEGGPLAAPLHLVGDDGELWLAPTTS